MMENQKKPIEEEIDPVSRKTNEEIDSDEEGNLIIGGKKIIQSAPEINDEQPKSDSQAQSQRSSNIGES